MRISQEDYDRYIEPFKRILEEMDKGDEELMRKRDIVLNRIKGIEVSTDYEDDLK